MNQERRVKVAFIDIVTAIYCGFCILELNSDNFKYICLMLFAVWTTVAFLSDNQAIKKVFQNKAVLILLIYTLIYFLYVACTRGIVYGLKYALTLIIAESPFFLFIYYDNQKNRSDLSKMLPWIGFIVILFLCFNILKLIAIDPNAARKMAANTNIYENYITGGGYQIAYALCLLVPFLIFSFKTNKHKVISFFFIVAFAYTLIKCSYTIAILLAAFELFLLFYWEKKKTSANRMISVLFFILLIGLFLFFREPIGNLFIEQISPWFSGSFVERRMMELGQFIKGEAGGTNGAATRMDLYWTSIKTFLNAPLIGISYLTNFVTENEVYSSGIRYIGLHSSIFDGFARVGLSFIIYIVYYFKAIKHLMVRTESNGVMIVGLIFFLIKILNIADVFGLSYIAFFAIPILCKYSKTSTQCVEM